MSVKCYWKLLWKIKYNILLFKIFFISAVWKLYCQTMTWFDYNLTEYNLTAEFEFKQILLDLYYQSGPNYVQILQIHSVFTVNFLLKRSYNCLFSWLNAIIFVLIFLYVFNRFKNSSLEGKLKYRYIRQ